MKTKFIIFLTCFFSIISIVASPALVVSADALFDEEIQALDCSFGDSVVNGVSMVLYNVETGDVTPLYFNGVREVDNDRGAQLIISSDTPFKAGERFLILVTLRIDNDSYLSPTNYIKGSYRIGFANERFRIIKDNTGDNNSYLAYTYRSNGRDKTNYEQFGSISYVDTQYGHYADSIYTVNKPGEVFDYYRTALYLQATTSGFYSFSLLLYYWDFDVMSITEYVANSVIENQDDNTDKIIQNQNENTDKILNFGEDIDQPDFDSANNDLDDTTNQMNKIESQYKLDKDDTQKSLNQGKDFIIGTDMQKASIQVKNWIEKFGSDNVVISGFLISCMALGVCFWVIGRKSW